MSLTQEILFGNLTSVQRKVQLGAKVNDLDDYGFTPLIEAVIAQKVDVAEFLLDQGADINFPDTTGRRAIHWAVDNANEKLCQLLLKRGADANSFTTAGEPVIVNPLLRQQQTLKELLMNHGAKLEFAQDFLNAKLLGHRFELRGQVDIVNANNEFIEIDFEGFFLEFTLGVVRDSLDRYEHNYAAKHLREKFNYLNQVIRAFELASALIRYQPYTINKAHYQQRIQQLITQDPLIIPIAYAGHAITWVKCGHYLAHCDRRKNPQLAGTVMLYEVGRINRLTPELLKDLFFKKQTQDFVEIELQELLDLRLMMTLPLPIQISGNCSWANIEAAVPALLTLLLQKGMPDNELQDSAEIALTIFQQWREWDKDRAIDECVQSFVHANKPRQASKAAVLAAILFQKCRYPRERDLAVAEKIMPILMLPEFEYLLRNYFQIYYRRGGTQSGKNLRHLLRYFDVVV